MPDDSNGTWSREAPRPRLYAAPWIASTPLPARSVAIILRTRDRPLLLPRAIESICGQTHTDWRLYLVNDGGDAREVAARLEPFAGRLAGRLARIDRAASPHGIWHAGQAGLDSAAEDLVVLHDDDDTWEPGFLAAVTRFLDDPAHARFAAVTTGCTLVEEEIVEGLVRERWRCPWPHGRGIVDLRQALVGAQLPPISLAFRRAVVAETGGFETGLRFLGDWEFLLRVLMVGDIGHIDVPLANYHHRVRGSGGSYGNTVVDRRPERLEQKVLLHNAMLRAGLRDRPEAIGPLRSVLAAIAEADPSQPLDALRKDVVAIGTAQRAAGEALAAGTAEVSALRRDLATMDARLSRIEEVLVELRQVSHWHRKGLQPLLWGWRRALPLRRAVALARGRLQPVSTAEKPAPPAPDFPARLASWRRRLVDVPLLGPRIIRRELLRRYIGHHGRAPELNPPRGFNAHMLARILRDRDPHLKVLCDKRAMREVVRATLGEDALVPLLGSWEDPDELPWDSLPPPYVVKPSHASGLVHFVTRPEEVQPSTLTAMSVSWLASDYFDSSYEWGYRGIPRSVMAEPLLRGPGGGRPHEVQVFTFGGRASHVRVVTGGKYDPGRTDNWFDPDGVRQPIRMRTVQGDYVLDPVIARRLAAMGEALGAGQVHLRVDLYLTEDGPKVGELTPYTLAGAAPWNPPELDLLFGRLWEEGAARIAGR